MFMEGFGARCLVANSRDSCGSLLSCRCVVFPPPQGNTVDSGDGRIPEEAAAEPRPADDALVTMRRGKKQRTKRKIPVDGADPDHRPEEGPVQVSVRGRRAAHVASVVKKTVILKGVCVQDDSKPPVEEEAGGAKRSSKRRKVSSAKDTETLAPEVKAASADKNAVAEPSTGGVYAARRISV